MAERLDKRIREVAARLFQERGIYATGMDTIVAEADIAKGTLYYHYKAKDDLIIAVLEELHQEWLERIRATQARSKTLKDRLLAFFTAQQEWIASDLWLGGVALHAMMEFSDPGDKVTQVSRRHWEENENYLRELLAELGVDHKVSVAKQLWFLLIGAGVAALSLRSTSPCQEARRAASALIDFHLSCPAAPIQAKRKSKA